MSILYVILIVIGVLVVLALVLFVSKGGNFHLIPRNITRVYKTLKLKHGDRYDNEVELLFVAGAINAKAYVWNDNSILQKILEAAESCADIQDEIQKVSDFARILMYEYFIRDSNTNPREISKAIDTKRDSIDKTVEREIKNSKLFPEKILERDVVIASKYYSELVE